MQRDNFFFFLGTLFALLNERERERYDADISSRRVVRLVIVDQLPLQVFQSVRFLNF